MSLGKAGEFIHCHDNANRVKMALCLETWKLLSDRSLHSDSTTSAPNQRLKATPQHIPDAFSQTQSLLSRAPPEVSLAGCVPLLMKLTKFYVFALSEPEVKPPLFIEASPLLL